MPQISVRLPARVAGRVAVIAAQDGTTVVDLTRALLRKVAEAGTVRHLCPELVAAE